MLAGVGDTPMTGTRSDRIRRATLRRCRPSSWRGTNRRYEVIQELRAFLLRGNIVELAVAVVIGVAFGAIVTSLVEDIITPLLGVIGIPDFSTWVIEVGASEMRIGIFLNTLVSFMTIAAAIFFLVLRPMARLHETEAAVDASEEDPGPSEVELLTQIRDELRKGVA